VPCPLCGGLIHPVAGRCKHCKEDLTQFRAGRPQAAAELPPLHGRPTPVTAPATTPAGNGTSVHAPAPTAPTPAAAESGPTILPQRTTGRHYEAQEPRRSWLRNWPILVIVAACVAIVIAVVMMVMPADAQGHGGKRELMHAPAPERMETSPKADPWSGVDPTPAPQSPAMPPSLDPDPDPVPQPRMTPDPPRQLDPDDPAGLMFTFLAQMCTRLSSCPGGDPTTQMMCNGLSMMRLPAAPSGCPAAQECSDAIAHMPCDNAGDPAATVQSLGPCLRALTEC
jgi:hypothetical protein